MWMSPMRMNWVNCAVLRAQQELVSARPCNERRCKRCPEAPWMWWSVRTQGVTHKHLWQVFHVHTGKACAFWRAGHSSLSLATLSKNASHVAFTIAFTIWADTTSFAALPPASPALAQTPNRWNLHIFVFEKMLRERLASESAWAMATCHAVLQLSGCQGPHLGLYGSTCECKKHQLVQVKHEIYEMEISGNHLMWPSNSQNHTI